MHAVGLPMIPGAVPRSAIILLTGLLALCMPDAHAASSYYGYLQVGFTTPVTANGIEVPRHALLGVGETGTPFSGYALAQRDAVIDAFAQGLGARRYFSVRHALNLGGGLVAMPGDVILDDGAGFSKVLDARTAGVPDGASVDAISLTGDGRLLLSFDIAVKLGGAVFDDADMVVYEIGNFSLYWRATDFGFDEAADLNALTRLGGGRFLMTFATGGKFRERPTAPVMHFWSTCAQAQCGRTSMQTVSVLAKVQSMRFP